MNQDDLGKILFKKVYEISYAASRIASVVKMQSFADRLFDQAILLLDLAGRGRYIECKVLAGSMEYLLRLGGDIGIAHIKNVEKMAEQLSELNSVIVEYEKLGQQPALVGIEDSFSKTQSSKQKKDEQTDYTFPPASFPEDLETVIDSEYDLDNQSEPTRENAPGTAKSAIRQSAILEIIRQKANCRLRDIQDSLRDASERTIRYDLQDLIKQGLVERVGSGGPSTYYKSFRVDGSATGGGVMTA